MAYSRRRIYLFMYYNIAISNGYILMNDLFQNKHGNRNEEGNDLFSFLQSIQQANTSTFVHSMSNFQNFTLSQLPSSEQRVLSLTTLALPALPPVHLKIRIGEFEWHVQSIASECSNQHTPSTSILRA